MRIEILVFEYLVQNRVIGGLDVFNRSLDRCAVLDRNSLSYVCQSPRGLVQTQLGLLQFVVTVFCCVAGFIRISLNIVQGLLRGLQFAGSHLITELFDQDMHEVRCMRADLSLGVMGDLLLELLDLRGSLLF